MELDFFSHLLLFFDYYGMKIHPIVKNNNIIVLNSINIQILSYVTVILMVEFL